MVMQPIPPEVPVPLFYSDSVLLLPFFPKNWKKE